MKGTPHHGASRDDWTHFDVMLGLTADLLPVVSNPKAVISPRSNMKDVGKVPSLYNGERQAVGMPEWTRHVTTGEEITRWSRDRDLGICIQTRHMRAIDVDITDIEESAAVRAFIAERFDLPTRSRNNSAKFLLAFEMPGAFTKRKFKTAHGIVEFLATGQQFIAVGRHPSGARYEWEGGLPEEFPILGAGEFEALWSALAAAFAIEAPTEQSASIKQAKLDAVHENDPVARHLHDKGMVKRVERDGRLHIVCPWEHEHTSDSGDSATTYWPAHTGGFERGGFQCLHAHCEARTSRDLEEVLGIAEDGTEDFDVIEEPSCGAMAAEGEEAVVLTDLSQVQPKPIDWVWHDWLARGMLHILAGRPGTGKTTLALTAAATLTNGGTWPDNTTCSRGRVLIWSGEDDLDRVLVPRLIAMGADLTQMQAVAGVPGVKGHHRPFDPSKDMPALSRQLRKSGGADLLILDSIVSAVSGDSHKNTEVRRGLQPVVDLAQEFNCAVLGISHYTKGTDGRDPVERVSGSLAFGALARVVLASAKMPDKEGGGYLVTRAKSNIGPSGGGFRYQLIVEKLDIGVAATRVEWGEPLDGAARDLLATADGEDTGGPATAVKDACQFLERVLRDGPLNAEEVKRAAKIEGFSEATLRRAKKALAISAHRIGGVGAMGVWNWSLPELAVFDAEGEK